MTQLNYLPSKILSNLYSKYSSSQDYFYTKHLDDLLEEIPTVHNLLFNDLKVLDEAEEFLKRLIPAKQSLKKIRSIKEKSEVPCIFYKWFNQLHQRWKDKKDRLKWKPNNNEEKRQEEVPMFLQEISAYNPQSSRYYLKGVQKDRYQEINQDTSLMSLEKHLSRILKEYEFEVPVKELPRDKNHNFKKKTIAMPQPIKINDKIILNLHTKQPKSLQSSRIVTSLSKDKLTKETRTMSSQILTSVKTANPKMRIKIQRSSSNSRKQTQHKLESTNSAEMTNRLRSYESHEIRAFSRKHAKNFITVNFEPSAIESQKIRRIRIRQV